MGWANSEPWFWVWLVAGLVSPPALPCPLHQGDVSSIALVSSPLAVMSKGAGLVPLASPQSQLSYTYTIRASSAGLLRGGAGPALLSAVAEGQGQLRGPPQVLGTREGGHISLTYTTAWQMQSVAGYPTVRPSGPAHPAPLPTGQPFCAAQVRSGACFTAAAAEGKGQLCSLNTWG